MNREIAEKWAQALESGKYKQAKGRLRRDDNFCCLGVLCDISGLDEWRNLHFEAKYAGSIITLPTSVQKWAEMQTSNGSFDHNAADLATLNDFDKTFPEIAQIIRQNVENL